MTPTQKLIAQQQTGMIVRNENDKKTLPT